MIGAKDLLPMKEIWRERPGDYYADSASVDESGAIAINVGGLVITKPAKEWHRLAFIEVVERVERLEDAVRELNPGLAI